MVWKKLDVTIPTAATRNVRSRRGAWQVGKQRVKIIPMSSQGKPIKYSALTTRFVQTTFCAGRNRNKELRRKGLQEEGKKERWGSLVGKVSGHLGRVVLATVLQQ